MPEDTVEEGEAAVEVVALFDDGDVRLEVPPDTGVAAAPPATGILEEPAEIVEVAVAELPPATSLHAKRTAGTPSGPSNQQFSLL